MMTKIKEDDEGCGNRRDVGVGKDEEEDTIALPHHASQEGSSDRGKRKEKQT
jgi:hypothetical protein